MSDVMGFVREAAIENGNSIPVLRFWEDVPHPLIAKSVLWEIPVGEISSNEELCDYLTTVFDKASWEFCAKIEDALADHYWRRAIPDVTETRLLLHLGISFLDTKSSGTGYDSNARWRKAAGDLLRQIRRDGMLPDQKIFSIFEKCKPQRQGRANSRIVTVDDFEETA
jgi:hypothetical protein